MQKPDGSRLTKLWQKAGREAAIHQCFSNGVIWLPRGLLAMLGDISGCPNCGDATDF